MHVKHYTNNNNNNNATDFNYDMRKFRVGLYLFCNVTKQKLQTTPKACWTIPEVERNLYVLHYHPVHYCWLVNSPSHRMYGGFMALIPNCKCLII